MKRFSWITAFIAGVIVLTSCAAEPVPQTLAFAGNYEGATVLVTVISPDSYIEYKINCYETIAELEGTDQLNAEDACASLSSPAVQERLFAGRGSSSGCSKAAPEEGQLQFLGVIGTTQINTFVDRQNSCGRSEWDNLFSHVALTVAPAETDD